MSSRQRNAEKRAEREARWQAESVAAEEERRRIANLPLYSRIEECTSVEDIKAALHIIAERAGLDLWS